MGDSHPVEAMERKDIYPKCRNDRNYSKYEHAVNFSVLLEFIRRCPKYRPSIFPLEYLRPCFLRYIEGCIWTSPPSCLKLARIKPTQIPMYLTHTIQPDRPTYQLSPVKTDLSIQWSAQNSNTFLTDSKTWYGYSPMHRSNRTKVSIVSAIVLIKAETPEVCGHVNYP